ncbi:hypothetical protein Efla_005141 [Eimeria flavescens]
MQATPFLYGRCLAWRWKKRSARFQVRVDLAAELIGSALTGHSAGGVLPRAGNGFASAAVAKSAAFLVTAVRAAMALS